VAHIAAARLQPRPRAVGHRGVDDPDQVGERAVDVAPHRFENALSTVDAHDELRFEHGVLRAFVVRKREFAESLAQLKCALEIRRRDT